VESDFGAPFASFSLCMVEDLTPHPMENRVEKKNNPPVFFVSKKNVFLIFSK